MKALLFAAGMGKRISKDIGGMPKSLLNVGGQSLIKRSVGLLNNLGFTVGVCTGYRFEAIENELDGMCSHFFLKQKYETTNNIYSLYLAKDFLDDDIIIMSADLFYDKKIIEMMLNDDSPLTLVVDSSRIKDGDYFLEVSGNNELLSYGKDLPFNKRSFENVGMVKISLSFLPNFIRELNSLVNKGETNLYFEQIIFNLAKQNPSIINFLDVSNAFWREIDNYTEYLSLKKEVKDC